MNLKFNLKFFNEVEEEYPKKFRKIVKKVLGLHFKIKTKQSREKSKTDKIVQKVDDRWR